MNTKITTRWLLGGIALIILMLALALLLFDLQSRAGSAAGLLALR